MNTLHQYTMASGYRETGFYVRGTGHFIIETPEPRETAHFGEIFWCVAGRGVFVSGGRRSVLHPGWLWYYPPGSVHEFYPGKPYFDYRWLSIEGKDAGGLFESLGIRPGLNQSGVCPEEEFARVELNLHDGAQQAQMRALSAAFAILTRAAAPEPDGLPAAAQAKTLMTENYGHGKLDVGRVAELLNLHRVTLSRQFAAAYGIAPGKYLESLRFQAGIRLLNTTDLPVKEIAVRCGFSSSGYFAKVIRRLTGQPPGFFRGASGKKDS